MSMNNIGRNILTSFANGLEKYASKVNGETVSQAANFATKCTLGPGVIMMNPYLTETDENKKWLALKQPVEAFWSLIVQYGAVLALGAAFPRIAKHIKFDDKLIEKYAKEFAEKAKTNAAKLDFRKEAETVLQDRIGTIMSVFTYFPALWLINKTYPKFAEMVISRKKDAKAPENVDGAKKKDDVSKPEKTASTETESVQKSEKAQVVDASDKKTVEKAVPTAAGKSVEVSNGNPLNLERKDAEKLHNPLNGRVGR